MLVLRNPGLIDETALTTQGVSVKVNDNPIGQFGTGMKIAIAVVLRLGGSVEVWRGLKKLEFGIKRKIVRGEEFELVTMNGRSLGFTTKFGARWEPWMAYREFWSNCRDESGEVFSTMDPPSPRSRTTTIVVRCRELERAHDERHKIVLQTGALAILPGLEVHAGRSQFVFYRQIRVAPTPNEKPSIYTYCLTGHQNLTEDRTLAYTWGLPAAIARALVQCTNPSMINDVLTSERDTLEYSLPWSQVKDQKPSPQFMETAESLHRTNKLTGSALELFKQYLDSQPGYVSPYLVIPTPSQEAVVTRALDMIERGANVVIPRQLIRFKEGRTYEGIRDEGEFTSVPSEDLNSSAEHLACGLLTHYAKQNFAGGRSMAWRILFGEWPERERRTEKPKHIEDIPL